MSVQNIMVQGQSVFQIFVPFTSLQLTYDGPRDLSRKAETHLKTKGRVRYLHAMLFKWNRTSAVDGMSQTFPLNRDRFQLAKQLFIRHNSPIGDVIEGFLVSFLDNSGVFISVWSVWVGQEN